MKTLCRFGTACLLFAVCCRMNGIATASEPAIADSDAKAKLLKSLEELEKSKLLTFRGAVREAPNGDDLKGLEVWRSPEGEVALMPAEAGVGVAVYDDGKHCMVRSTRNAHQQDASIDVAVLTDELPLLLNLATIKQYASAAGLKKSTNGDEVTYIVPLSTRIFREVKKRDLLDRVSNVEVRIVCDGEGRVKALEFQVAHKPATKNGKPLKAVPTKAEIDKEIERDVADVVGSGKEDEQGRPMMFDADQLRAYLKHSRKADYQAAAKLAGGATTVFSLSLTNQEPSRRLRAFTEEMREEVKK